MTRGLGKENVRILVACTDQTRKPYFINLNEQEHFSVVLCESMEELQKVRQCHPDVDMVLIAVDADTPENREIAEYVIAIANQEQIPTLAIVLRDEPAFEEFLYDKSVTQCVPANIAEDKLTKRLQKILELFMNSRQMRELLARRERELEEQRETLHYRDDLTGCLNLAGFRRRAKEILRGHTDWQYMLWYCDIKDFKYINERLGYEQGNDLLRYWGQLALDYKIEGEVIGCLTGDRFVGLIRVTEDNESSQMECVLDKVRNYFRDRGIAHDVQIITGIYSLTAEDYETANIDHMIANAKLAQQRLKESAGKERWSVFNPEQLESDRRRMMISSHLPQAIKDEEIEVYFQPQYNYSNGKLRGAEALCRWNHAELGWISPGEFIPVLEKTGQVTDLDIYVWEQVCKCLHKWKKEGICVPVSVNISREDVRSRNLTEMFEGLLRKYELSPDMLHLEITESSYFDHANVLIREVTNLVNAGFSVEMDDFGSGYSSLNMLKEVPVNVLKMDLRFLSNEGDSFRSGNIINHVVRMAHTMHIEVVAEGVETTTQADFLKSCGCCSMQGFLFSKPVPLAEFEQLIRGQQFDKCKPAEDNEARKYMEHLLSANDAGSILFNRFLGAACIFSYDGENLELVLANDAVYREAGSSMEEFPRGHFACFDRLAPGSSEILQKVLENTLSVGQATGVICTGDTGQYLQVRFHYLYKEGNEHFLFCEQRNVTQEQVLQEQQAQNFEQMYQYLKLQQSKLMALQKIPGVIVFDYDPQTDCLDISVGLENNELEEKKIEHFSQKEDAFHALTPESAARLKEVFDAVCEDGSTGSIDIMGSPMGLDFGWVRCTYTCLKDDNGAVEHIFGRMQSIENDMRLNEELRAKAEHDSMTNLLNHDASIEGIRMHLGNHEGGTLMMIDVDDFKLINDLNSHLYGDTVLKRLAKELWKSFRRTDLIGRFGGDEFLVYLPGSFDEEFAMRKAGEINHFCNHLKVNNIEQFSLSIGIAIADENEDITAEEFIDRADRALYEVKRNGKNAVNVYKK